MPRTTDPEAKLYRKSAGTTAKFCYMGHAVSENRHGLVVVVQSEASGTAERSSALEMIELHRGTTPGTASGDVSCSEWAPLVSNSKPLRSDLTQIDTFNA